MAGKTHVIEVTLNGTMVTISPLSIDIEYGGERTLVWRRSKGSVDFSFFGKSVDFADLTPIHFVNTTDDKVEAVITNYNQISRKVTYKYRLHLLLRKDQSQITYPSMDDSNLSRKPVIRNLPR